MPSKEITNAAKAIYESRNGAGRTPWSQLPWSHKVPYLDDAEAARKSFLTALQEPTEAMVCAVDHDDCATPDNAQRAWRKMLAASPLGEQSE